jgi:hypothetical protein
MKDFMEVALICSKTSTHNWIGRFQATGTPMAKDLRLLREITTLHNFAIEKVEKNISLQRFRD